MSRCACRSEASGEYIVKNTALTFAGIKSIIVSCVRIVPMEATGRWVDRPCGVNWHHGRSLFVYFMVL